ncbi:7tm Chemosensory receptor [Popillia japonica]|uniref:7tm Chemosensory receptor n=1 Tax=Popillia japonica TaxID=7064 RepID=A0AAW1NMU4_POPJA
MWLRHPDNVRLEVGKCLWINAFALQLLHERVEVSAGGFFIVDVTILVSMLSVAVTYACLLYQYSTDMDMFGVFFGTSSGDR